MALKCTNTSGPSSCEMKPYPFSALNHFTTPVATCNPLLSGRHGPHGSDDLRLGALPGSTCRPRVLLVTHGAEPSRACYQPDGTGVRGPNRSERNHLRG